MNEFLKIVLGDQTQGSFFAYLLFAVIGIMVKLLWHVTQRNAASPNTPVDFSFKFMITDNSLRLIASLALSLFVVLVSIRFCNEFLHVQLSPFIALFIGLGSDSLSEQLKNLAATKVPFTDTSASTTDKTGEDKVIDTSKPAAEQIETGPVAATTIQTEQQPAPAASDQPNQQQGQQGAAQPGSASV